VIPAVVSSLPEQDPEAPAWSRGYLAAWALWAAAATYAGVWGTPGLRPLWWGLMAAFGLLEAVGAIARSDRAPMLTEVFGRYVPPWLLYAVLALAMWRLSNWVPGWILWPGCGWQLIHFVSTYHAYGRLGGEHPLG
jgi:hypothetical protein